jgi:hypothetical protein
MPSDFTYEIHKTAQAERFRHRERDLSHRSALKAAQPRQGMVSRIVSGLDRLRPMAARRAAIADDAHELTDYICRLADGSMGRVAIHESDGEWIGVCVPA